jgi:hypothetical protein
MEGSTFGHSLLACSRALKHTDDDLWAELYPLNRPTVWKKKSADPSTWGPPYIAMTAVRDVWLRVAWQLNMQGVRGPDGLLARIERQDYLKPAQFDEMWRTYDEVLWMELKESTQPGWHAEAARQFGLYDIDDPARPTCSGYLLREIFGRMMNLAGAERRANVPAPAAPVLVQPTSQSVAQSAHAYLAQGGAAPKEKPKTRKAGTVEVPVPTEEESESGQEEDLPEALPLGYKLGKKHLKVRCCCLYMFEFNLI